MVKISLAYNVCAMGIINEVFGILTPRSTVKLRCDGYLEWTKARIIMS